MITLTEKQRWNLISLGSAILAGVLVRAAIRTAWKAARHDQPPLKPFAREETWPEAISFAIGTGVAVGLARLGGRSVANRVRKNKGSFDWRS